MNEQQFELQYPTDAARHGQTSGRTDGEKTADEEIRHLCGKQKHGII